jgi:hypothetical protein
MDARVAFTSAGVNRAAGALDWDLGRGDHGGADDEGDEQQRLIAYGSASAVCMFDPEVRQRWRNRSSSRSGGISGRASRTREREREGETRSTTALLLLD